MRKVVFIIDCWFMRKRIYRLKSFYYSGPEIRKYCLKHLRKDKEDELYRIFYYDTKPLNKKGHNPITGKSIDFGQTKVAEHQRKLLESIKTTANFALRLGELSWTNNDWALRGDKLKDLIKKKISIGDLTEDDVSPVIEQKTVDMKMGLDIALISLKKLADLLIIVTGDSDIVPALKFARREGMQVLLDSLKNPVRAELKEHIDFFDTKV